MDDINKAIDTLKGMLQTEEGKQTLNSLIQNISGNGTSNSNENTSPQQEAPLPVSSPNSNNGFNLGNMGNFNDLLSSVQNGSNAPRMQLMGALKPYLSSRRQQRFGTIMNLMKYSEVPAALLGRLNKR